MFVALPVEQLGGSGQIALLIEGCDLLVLTLIFSPELIQLLNRRLIVGIQLHRQQILQLAIQNRLIVLQAGGIFLYLFRGVFFQHAQLAAPVVGRGDVDAGDGHQAGDMLLTDDGAGLVDSSQLLDSKQAEGENDDSHQAECQQQFLADGQIEEERHTVSLVICGLTKSSPNRTSA